MLKKREDSKNDPECELWMDVSSPSVFDSYTRFLEDGFLSDVTLLVGPKQDPIRVHRIILAAHFEYFISMFSTGLKESTSAEVHLPFIGPEDLRLILKYVYRGEADLTKENVFKMAIMANYFEGKDLMHKCCNFLKNYTNTQNCVNLLKFAVQMNINQLRRNCFLFIVENLPAVNKDDLSALPVDFILEIIQHPAAQMCYGNYKKSEKQLFNLIWNRIKCLPEETKTIYIPKVLRAIHLPKTNMKFLFFLLKEFGHIPEIRQLIIEAEKETDASETREWYLMRSNRSAWVTVEKHNKPIEVNGITIDEYSVCVLVKGFPFFVYAIVPNSSRKRYHVESPVAIEHLGYPYKVILQMRKNKEWISVNTYHNGVVDKSAMDESYKDQEGWFKMRVRFQGE